MRRFASFVCVLTILAGCSGEGSDEVLTACTDASECPEGVACTNGYCQGEAPAIDDGEATVTAQGSSSGTDAQVTVTASGGECTDASCEVRSGATVTFSAPEVGGFRFAGWSGDARCMGAEPVLVLENVETDITCIANYVARHVVAGRVTDGGPAPLAASSDPFASCSGAACEVDANGTVTLTAAPRDGQRLAQFSGAGCEDRDGDVVTVVATRDVTCTAEYVAGARVTGQVAGADASVEAASSSPGASCSGSGCTLDLGGQVTLTAPSVAGHRFAGWSGSAGCTGTTESVVLDDVQSDLICTATYVPRRTVSGMAEGATPQPTLAASSSDGFATCEGAGCEVDVGSAVELRAPTVPGYRLASWSGAGCGDASGDKVTVSDVQSDVTCTAHYVQGIAVSGTVSGAPGAVAASSSSPGASCSGATCQIDVGGSVTLTAPSVPRHRFLGWAGDAGCSGSSLTITLASVDSSRSCTARYRERVTIAGEPLPSNGGSIAASSSSANATCSGSRCEVDEGSAVSLVASAAGGFRFTGWSGGGACTGTAATLSLAGVSANLTCQANFTRRFTATGEVAGAPAGTAISAGSSASPPVATCSGPSCTVDSGTPVTLTAPAVSGHRFVGWSAGCTDSDGDGNARTLRLAAVTENRTCTATYVLQVTVTVTSSPSGLGSVAVQPAGGRACAGDSCVVDAGSSVTITASETSAARFDGWSGSGGCAGSGATRTFTATSTTTCTAQFFGLWSRSFSAGGRGSDLTYDVSPRADGSLVLGGMLGAAGDTRALIAQLDGNSGALGTFRATRRPDVVFQGGGLTGSQASGYGLVTGQVVNGNPRPVILRFDENLNLLGATGFFGAGAAPDQLGRIALRAGTGYAAAGHIDGTAPVADRAHVVAASTTGTFLFDRSFCLVNSCADPSCYSTRAVDIAATSTGFAVLSVVDIPIPAATNAGVYGMAMLTELDATGATTRERVFGRRATHPATGALEPTSFEPAGLVVASNGAYVVVGSTRENPTATTYDAFAMRLDPADLSIVWQSRVGNANIDERFGRVAVAESGTGFAIVGAATGDAGTYDGWFVQLSASGALVGGTDTLYDLGELDLLGAVAVMPTGGYVLGGYHFDSADAGTGYDAWALRVDGTGDIGFNASSGAVLSSGSHATPALGAEGPVDIGCTFNQSQGRAPPAVTDVESPAISIVQEIQAP
jgi:hypothetical protein